MVTRPLPVAVAESQRWSSWGYGSRGIVSTCRTPSRGPALWTLPRCRCEQVWNVELCARGIAACSVDDARFYQIPRGLWTSHIPESGCLGLRLRVPKAKMSQVMPCLAWPPCAPHCKMEPGKSWRVGAGTARGDHQPQLQGS